MTVNNVRIEITNRQIYKLMSPFLRCTCPEGRVNVLLTQDGVACPVCGVDLSDGWNDLRVALGLTE